MLLEVYYVYFFHEIKGNYDPAEMRQLSEKVFFELLRDFDICPTLVTKTTAYKIFLAGFENNQSHYLQTALDVISMAGWQQISHKQLGQQFTFSHFLDMLVRLSKTSYGMTFDSFNFSKSRSTLILAEMVCLLLERMELSKGFMDFEKKTCRPHTSKLTLLPSKQVINQIQFAKGQVYEETIHLQAEE